MVASLEFDMLLGAKTDSCSHNSKDYDSRCNSGITNQDSHISLI